MASVGLLHLQVNVSIDAVEGIYEGLYRLDANDQTRLRAKENVIEVWPKPPKDHLHVFIGLPRGVPVSSPSILREGFFFSSGNWVMFIPCSARHEIWYEAAENLHRAMWRNDLSRLLKVDRRNGFEYPPATEVQSLGLQVLGCKADAILFREEYIFILKRLEGRRPNISTIMENNSRVTYSSRRVQRTSTNRLSLQNNIQLQENT